MNPLPEFIHRPRRNRKSNFLREMLRETKLSAEDFIYPLFVKDGESISEPVASMPGISRHPIPLLLQEIAAAAEAGIRAVAIFPCIDPALKDAHGSHALSESNLLFRALRAVHEKYPQVVLVADVALDPYTSHGHDGVLDATGADVDNDATVELLCELAVKEAKAGATIVAPSDMMDGRVGAIRRALDAQGFSHVGILSYAAKYASAFYGPFRDAVGSKIGKDAISKAGYQLDPANVREAMLEVEMDIEEGADMVMVKPAGAYLDVIQRVASFSRVPVCAYQVSGEYAQIHAAARLGWLDYKKTRDESLLAIKRAGADVILSYFAKEWCEENRS